MVLALWRAGIDLAIGRYRISYEYRGNEGGSGEPRAGLEGNASTVLQEAIAHISCRP